MDKYLTLRVKLYLVKDVMSNRQNWSCKETFDDTQVNHLLMQCYSNTVVRLQQIKSKLVLLTCDQT